MAKVVVIAITFIAIGGAGPHPRSESVVVLREDRYVNLVLYNAPAGAVDQLVEPLSKAL